MMTTRREIDLRAMKPARKIAVMHALIQQAYDLKAAGLRMTRPELSETEVQILARRLVAGDGS